MMNRFKENFEIKIPADLRRKCETKLICSAEFTLKKALFAAT